MKTPDEGWLIGKQVYRRGDWNRLEVIARGPQFEIRLNGRTTVRVTDDHASSGVIALQLHQGEAMKVEFRDIRMKALEKTIHD